MNVQYGVSHYCNKSRHIENLTGEGLPYLQDS